MGKKFVPEMADTRLINKPKLIDPEWAYRRHENMVNKVNPYSSAYHYIDLASAPSLTKRIEAPPIPGQKRSNRRVPHESMLFVDPTKPYAGDTVPAKPGLFHAIKQDVTGRPEIKRIHAAPMGTNFPRNRLQPKPFATNNTSQYFKDIGTRIKNFGTRIKSKFTDLFRGRSSTAAASGIRRAAGVKRLRHK